MPDPTPAEATKSMAFYTYLFFAELIKNGMHYDLASELTHTYIRGMLGIQQDKSDD